MSSRDTKDLAPEVRVLFDKFSDRCRRDTDLLKDDVTILVTCTYRSGAEQDKLYSQGRDLPGHIVTNARAGKSLHNVALPDGTPAARAFDIVPLRQGKPVWGTTGDDLALWQKLGAHGKAVGLEWAGDWEHMKEFPHMQLRA